MKLKNPDYPIYLYPTINSHLVLMGEPKHVKVEDNKIEIIYTGASNCKLIRVGEIGFSWVWDNDLDYTLSDEENERL